MAMYNTVRENMLITCHQGSQFMPAEMRQNNS